MALEVGLAQTRGSLATLFKHEESGDRETVELHRASFSNVGSESLAGGMTVRTKRLSAVTAEPSNNSCPHLETLIVSSCSSSKVTVNSGSLVSSPAVRSQPVLNVLQKKHNSSVTDKRHSVKWLDAMKAQSPPRFHSLHGDTPESYDIEAAKYAAWMVNNNKPFMKICMIRQGARINGLLQSLDLPCCFSSFPSCSALAMLFIVEAFVCCFICFWSHCWQKWG